MDRIKEGKMKELDLEEELDTQFPKGDKARGKALVLYGIAQLKLKDLPKQIFKEIEKLVINKDIESQLVISRDSFEKLKKKWLKEVKESC